MIKKIQKIVPNPILKYIKKHYYFNKLKTNTFSDEEDLLLLKMFVKPGDTVIDIGANIGIYTKFLSNLAGTNGTVISIEPVPETFYYLQHNIKRLKLLNTNAYCFACSATKGNAIMQIPKFENKTDNFYEATITTQINNKLKNLQIKTETLDNCTNNKKNITFIKCDVEGHELEVLLGAKQVLTTYKPVWLLEINDNLNAPEKKTEELLQIFNNHNYKIYINNKQTLIQRTSEIKTNYWFIPTSIK